MFLHNNAIHRMSKLALRISFYFGDDGRYVVMMLTRLLKFSALTALAIAITGCFENNTKQNLCSNEWYLLVEKQISTGDSQGHGPDLGSIEWRSTIEFKLGIRDQPKIPAIDTEQWCSYINEHFIKPAP